LLQEQRDRDAKKKRKNKTKRDQDHLLCQARIQEQEDLEEFSSCTRISTKVTEKNLIVNYLPQEFTDRCLYNLFIPFGSVESVKIMKDLQVLSKSLNFTLNPSGLALEHLSV